MLYNITWHMLYNITWHMLYNITWHMLYSITWHMLYNINKEGSKSLKISRSYVAFISAHFKQCKQMKRYFFTWYPYELKIRWSSLFVSPMTNFSSWTITMPLYSSSKVFVPAEQYGITIYSPWIWTWRTIVTLFTSNHIFKRRLSFQAIHLNAQ